VFGQAGVAWLGEGERLADRQEDFAWTALAGIGWQVSRGWELKAQLDAHSAVFDEPELEFLGEAVVLTFGGDYRFVCGWHSISPSARTSRWRARRTSCLWWA
jgi:hypothetical protein